jgi:hypothetical protein
MTAAEQITEYLAKQDEARTVAEIAEATNIKAATVERQMRALRDADTVREVGVADGNKKTWALATRTTAPGEYQEPTKDLYREAHESSTDASETPRDDPDAEVEADFTLPEPTLAVEEQLSEADETEMVRRGMTREEWDAAQASASSTEETVPAPTEDTDWNAEETAAYEQRQAATDEQTESELPIYRTIDPDAVIEEAEEAAYAEDRARADGTFVPPPSSAKVEDMATDTKTRKPRKNAATKAPKTTGGPRAEQRFFHKRGELSDEILTFLAEYPGEQFTPHRIAKTEMAGTGSIAYALEALTKKGKVTRTNDKPKTYQHLDPSLWPVEETKTDDATEQATEATQEA